MGLPHRHMSQLLYINYTDPMCCVWYKYLLSCSVYPFIAIIIIFHFLTRLCPSWSYSRGNNIFPSFCWGIVSIATPSLAGQTHLFPFFMQTRRERERETVREEKDCLASKTNAISAHKHSIFGFLLGSGQIMHNGLIFNICPIYLLGAIIFLLCCLERLGTLSIVVCKFTNSTA